MEEGEGGGFSGIISSTAQHQEEPTHSVGIKREKEGKSRLETTFLAALHVICIYHCSTSDYTLDTIYKQNKK